MLRRHTSPIAILAILTLASTSWAQEQSEDSAKWTVDLSLGPADTLQFETSEGTWMNVDVSPDGRTIVFDLLGDIYTMPIGGGRATRITMGAAFDMQPRFSPDGSKIAFISDRSGLNNVWVMPPDGTDPKQVSKESSRDVNSPAWSPDGQYIFVRKHFVERRSLGAGEVWMYHVSGANGLQVTERNGWQKDAGEPALSADGRYLYYSKDVTPGQTFQYNKDPYGTIYAIVRRDLHDGSERTLVRRAGGSITPQPSPDGAQLAFVRRVRLQTVLFVRDLETGEEWPLFDGLSRDMQEAWAIHGVYTQYAWTPDGSAIVIWAKGKIWRVDVAARSATEIPFTAEVEQVIHEALRFPQEVTPERFPVKMLRDITTAPDERSVAYSALGTLYRKQMPDGAPQRVTGDDRLEFDPEFSPDGQWLVYTTWTDADKGRVRVVRTNGRDGRDVVAVPGHYIEPSFSPDGRWIVYRSGGGDFTRGPTHGEHRGIFVVPVDGSAAPRLVTESGSQPLFDHTGERLFLRGFRNQRATLYSVDLRGNDEVVHFQSSNATDMVPSPDGQWLAFVERYRVFVATFPRSGRPITIGPDARSHPVTRVSKNAGTYLHWSADSRQLHWTLGPEYFSRDLTSTFPFVAGGAEEADEPQAEGDGTQIGFTAASDIPTGTVAFVGARVVTLAGGAGEVIENGTVVVRGNRITAVGQADRVQVPSEAHQVDARGKTIIPGLIDVHAHVGGEGSGILAQASWPLMANVAYGVTTSHDPSNNTTTVFTNSEMIRAGLKLGPRLFSTGTILYGAETPFKAVVSSYDDAVAHLSRMKAVGAFSVKSYNQRRRDARQWIVKAARELEMMVVPEGGSLVYQNMTMVTDGHTGVEHSLPVPDVHDDLARFFGASGTGYTPTLVVGYGGLSGEFYWYERTDVWAKDHLLTFVPRDVVDSRSRRRLNAAGDDDFNHVLIARGAKAIADAGGSVQLGAHGQLQGLGAHWELWMFVQGGMTPLEALRAATIDGAWYLGLDRDLGTIEEGKLADLVVLGANPLEEITNTELVELVMLNGRLYDARTLNEIGNHPSPRRPLYWERGPGS
jgi:Tol biopolymer transport system component/imidazolonepropionase-like amidohydrolase